MSEVEQVVLVDAQDNVLGVEEKLVAHRLGLLHRAFSIFLFRKREEIELLLQKRHPLKYHCGGLWTNTCCSHPRENETLLDAANRRLQEEMMIQTTLYPLGTFLYKAELKNGLIEHELDHVLIGHYDAEIKVVNNQEVADIRWVEIPALQKALRNEGSLYTPWFSQALDLILSNPEDLNKILV